MQSTKIQDKSEMEMRETLQMNVQKQHWRIIKKLWIVLILFACTSVRAAPIDIFQLSSFINATEFGTSSLEDTQIGSGFNDYGSSGLGVLFNNNLGANNLGSVTWEITNNTGFDLSSVNFFGFLDAEITEPGNSFFNEFGTLVDVSGTGAGDIAADTWEIDEPGFLFGDIFGNLVDGILDNSNAVPDGLNDDVSLALGFDVGTLLAGQSMIATFFISDQNIGGLSHSDPDAGTTFFFNGTVEVFPIEVSLPGTLLLIFIGLMSMAGRRKSSTM